MLASTTTLLPLLKWTSLSVETLWHSFDYFFCGMAFVCIVLKPEILHALFRVCN